MGKSAPSTKVVQVPAQQVMREIPPIEQAFLPPDDPDIEVPCIQLDFGDGLTLTVMGDLGLDDTHVPVRVRARGIIVKRWYVDAVFLRGEWRSPWVM